MASHSDETTPPAPDGTDTDDSREAIEQRLAQADSQRAASAEAAAQAFATYVDCRSALDPASDSGRERFRWSAAQIGERGADFGELATRMAAEAPDAATKVRANVLLARLAREGGDVAQARHHVDRALLECGAAPGTDNAASGAASLEGALVCLADGRVALGYVLARRARRLLQTAGNAAERAESALAFCGAARRLGDVDAFHRAVPDAERAIDALPSATSGPRRLLLLAHRADVAQRAGPAADALALCDDLERLDREAAPDVDRSRWFAAYRSSVHLRHGRWSDGLFALADAGEFGAGVDALDVYLDALALRARCRLGTDPALPAAAERVLGHLEAPGASGLHTQQMELALDLAQALTDAQLDGTLVLRALDLALTATARAVAVVHRAVGDLRSTPHVSSPQVEADDVAALERLGPRLESEHRAALTRARILIGNASTHSPRGLAAARTSRGLAQVCAACGRVEVPEAGWMPLDAYARVATTVDLSVGFCERCLDERD